MNVRNCKSCGKLFNYIVGPIICPACKDSLEAKFQEVKKYVRENKGANITTVAEECDVEVSQIRQWVREERLEFAEGSMIGIGCEKCGAVIKSGRFCDKCKAEMVNGFSNAFGSGRPAKPEPPKKDDGGSRMRFLK